MKNILYIFITLLGFTALSQNKLSDTVELQEVVIQKNQKKPKIKLLRYNSSCTTYTGMRYNGELITLVNEPIEGYLQSISFFLYNDVKPINDLFKGDDFSPEFIDVELELVFYEAKPDNTPGERIETKKCIIPAKADDSRRLTVDVSYLNFKCDKPFFIGVKRITPVGEKQNDFEIDCLCNRSEKYIGYIRYKENGEWWKSKFINALKMVYKSRSTIIV